MTVDFAELKPGVDVHGEGHKAGCGSSSLNISNGAQDHTTTNKDHRGRRPAVRRLWLCRIFGRDGRPRLAEVANLLFSIISRRRFNPNQPTAFYGIIRIALFQRKVPEGVAINSMIPGTSYSMN